MSQPPAPGMTTEAGAAHLRGRAEALAGPLPPLLAEAQHLAQTVLLGQHGRRRAGVGDEFWQYRAAMPGDAARAIDWRRSGRSDGHFVRQREWQAAQSVEIWVDRGQGMGFASSRKLPQKGDRARLLALAAAVLLIRGGERVGLAEPAGPRPRGGQVQLARLAASLGGGHDPADSAQPPSVTALVPRSRGLFLSDFLGDPAPVVAAVEHAAARGMGGALVMLLDPEEAAFPFAGRTIFESMGGALRHETLEAGELKDRYLSRLAERVDLLEALARRTGWRFAQFHTDAPAAKALLWIHGALERAR